MSLPGARLTALGQRLAVCAALNGAALEPAAWAGTVTPGVVGAPVAVAATVTPEHSDCSRSPEPDGLPGLADLEDQAGRLLAGIRGLRTDGGGRELRRARADLAVSVKNLATPQDLVCLR